MKTPRVFLSILLTMAALSPVRAQGVLEGYIQEGLKSNLQLRQEQINYEKSVEGLNVAKGLFLPQVGLNASYMLATGGRKIQFPVGDLLNPVYSALNTLTDSNQFPQLENQNIQFLPNNFHDTKLRVIQPLFNPDIYFNYKAQKELITVQHAQRNAYENELKFSISSSYYQYLQSEEALKVLRETRGFLVELVKLNQKLVANQKATRDVVLGAEYELNKIDQQIAEGEKSRQVARAYFNFLLNRDLAASIEVDSGILSGPAQNFDLRDLTSTAMAQRQELKQAQAGLAATGHVVEMNKTNALLPKVNLVGDAGYQGFEYKFNSEQQYMLLQFNLSWDLFRGGEKKAKTQQARLDHQVAENKMEQLKKQIELQVIQNHYERIATHQAYVTAESGLRSADKNFQIVRARYNEGQAILLEYLDAQNKWTTARLMQSIRRYDLLRSEAALQKTISGI